MVVTSLESSIAKTDDVTSGRRDVDPHGQLQVVQRRMGQWKILHRSPAEMCPKVWYMCRIVVVVVAVVGY